MGSEAAQLLEAADFAAQKHRQQRRKDPEGTPYINHPIGVARILTHEAGITDIAVLQAALLHDTVEDTDTTLDEVELHFGAQVRRLVEEVTDDKTLPKLERKRQQVEQAPHSSPGAKLVKLADKLYNLRDLNRCTPRGVCPLLCRMVRTPSPGVLRVGSTGGKGASRNEPTTGRGSEAAVRGARADSLSGPPCSPVAWLQQGPGKTGFLLQHFQVHSSLTFLHSAQTSEAKNSCAFSLNRGPNMETRYAHPFMY
ncbi:guanosine-3',5'-bis(diphosphate) 3'-pyrophosphohydrolase MESH1 isoform X2 [Arvicanthis niloticus]|uniref:guanosine-3',5'-bis(diphosphate) 3'-pyrophosphohydrolase MESH1 isoform X2 n=1 Tax=Arvicanthis niloticus TaxID=61156 RepID=UPI00402B8FF7